MYMHTTDTRYSAGIWQHVLALTNTKLQFMFCMHVARRAELDACRKVHGKQKQTHSGQMIPWVFPAIRYLIFNILHVGMFVFFSYKSSLVRISFFSPLAASHFFVVHHRSLRVRCNCLETLWMFRCPQVSLPMFFAIILKQTATTKTEVSHVTWPSLGVTMYHST